MGFFEDQRDSFELLKARWRAPQRGAIGALMAHWSLGSGEPALISLPTGTGKTGVALAAPFVTEVAPRRVLVLVPSTALREQTVHQFHSMRLLREIGAIYPWYEPSRVNVAEVTNTSTDWTGIEDADVVVAIPQSVSPASASDVSVPPADMFDVVIVDEAHHMPATTWKAVVDHLACPQTVFLTATPFRRDKKPVPGARAYHYPLHQAIDDGAYKPIRPVILARPEPYDIGARDDVISGRVSALLAEPQHASSALLVRAKNVKRAEELAARYQALGISIEVLTSRLSEAKQTSIVRRLISGETRAVAVVGMLGEGFDLPRLRIVAYHDKHKSMPATVQLIGRLARVSDEFPQESVLVTVDDSDVHPELIGAVRELYSEDADWATIIPGLIDAEVAESAANTTFIESLAEREGEIRLSDLHPMPGPIVYEVDHPNWRPYEPVGDVPDQLAVGARFAAATVLTSATAPDGSFLAFVTRRRTVPPWSADLTLENVDYNLTLVSFRPAPRTDLPSLLFIDTQDGAVHRALLDSVLRPPEGTRPVSSERLDGYMQSLPRISVSSIGMRNILAGTRGTSYKTRAGSSTDIDLLTSETTQTALGHLMMQVMVEGSSTTVGAAFEKGKIWERRYKPFVNYAGWITESATLLWFPRTGSTGAALLPQISRGRRLEAWPESVPLAVEPNPATVRGGFQLFDGESFVGALEDLDLHAGLDPTGALNLPAHTADTMPMVAVIHDRAQNSSTVCWTGTLSPAGAVTPAGHDLIVHRGYTVLGSFSEFLEEYPPLIYFLNGQATQGHELFDVQGGSSQAYDPRILLAHDWDGAGVDLSAETRVRALAHGRGISIHEGLEGYLRAQPKAARHRWIICNDGSGEIADYLVIEWTRGEPVRLSLWHAKAAGGAPGLRIDDFQVVIAQALRSRAWFNDPQLWTELRERLMGRRPPRATLVAGSDHAARLLMLLGERDPSGRRPGRTWLHTPPLVHGEIAIVQPGLSRDALRRAPSHPGTTASSIHQLFGLLADTVAVTGNRAIVLGSP
ncbi:MAG TPA: DEAD/DEAH box helicase family protein [Iamia sp.]|nr:DEAD/DEAH box helicase family protein [Iamia sp.]